MPPFLRLAFFPLPTPLPPPSPTQPSGPVESRRPKCVLRVGTRACATTESLARVPSDAYDLDYYYRHAPVAPRGAIASAVTLVFRRRRLSVVVVVVSSAWHPRGHLARTLPRTSRARTASTGRTARRHWPATAVTSSAAAGTANVRRAARPMVHAVHARRSSRARRPLRSFRAAHRVSGTRCIYLCLSPSLPPALLLSVIHSRMISLINFASNRASFFARCNALSSDA